MDPEKNNIDPAHLLPREFEEPAIVWEEELDLRQSLAFACGKFPGGSLQCSSNPRFS